MHPSALAPIYESQNQPQNRIADLNSGYGHNLLYINSTPYQKRLIAKSRYFYLLLAINRLFHLIMIPPQEPG